MYYERVFCLQGSAHTAGYVLSGGCIILGIKGLLSYLITQYHNIAIQSQLNTWFLISKCPVMLTIFHSMWILLLLLHELLCSHMCASHEPNDATSDIHCFHKCKKKGSWSYINLGLQSWPQTFVVNFVWPYEQYFSFYIHLHFITFPKCIFQTISCLDNHYMYFEQIRTYVSPKMHA